MGSENSLETTITNVAGQRLVYTGNAPNKFGQDVPLFYKYDDTTMNLWMLLIDFIPYYPRGLVNFPRSLYFRGGGEPCEMTAEFVCIFSIQK
jgi:hypothetical protein